MICINHGLILLTLNNICLKKKENTTDYQGKSANLRFLQKSKKSFNNKSKASEKSNRNGTEHSGNIK